MKRKIVFLEGLPGVGKTTIIKKIKDLNLKNITVVDEIIYEKIFENINLNQELYLKNDNMKIAKSNKNITIIDRGPISTFSYNQVRHIVDIDFDISQKRIDEWFKKYLKMYAQENVWVYYLTKKKESYLVRYPNDLDPYGNKENQKLLEQVTIFNCKKYIKNIQFKEFDVDNDNIMEFINEIVS